MGHCFYWFPITRRCHSSVAEMERFELTRGLALTVFKTAAHANVSISNAEAGRPDRHGSHHVLASNESQHPGWFSFRLLLYQALARRATVKGTVPW